jgi:hypothetical protein
MQAQQKEALIDEALDAIDNELNAWRRIPSPHNRPGMPPVTRIMRFLTLADPIGPAEVIPESTVSFYDLPDNEVNAFIRYVAIKKAIEMVVDRVETKDPTQDQAVA